MTRNIERAVASSLTGLYIFAKTGDFAGWGQAEEPCISYVYESWNY